MFLCKSQLGVLCLVAVAVLPSLTLAQLSQYEVRGKWSRGNEETSFGWFATREAAQSYINETNRDYGPDGLMRSAPSKPVNLRIVPPAEGDKKPSPRLKSFFETTNEFLEKVKQTNELSGYPSREPGIETGPLDEFISQIETSYELAKDAKKKLLQVISSTTQKEFDRVNQLIDTYNENLSKFQSGPQGSAFTRFPQMARVSPEVGRRYSAWQKGLDDQFRLEREKAKLDEQKASLDKIRADLLGSRSDLAEREQSVAKLRVRASSGGGPFKVKYIAYDPPARIYGTYDSLEKARSALAELRAKPPAGMVADGGVIEDKDGKTVGNDYTPPPPDPVRAKDLRQKEEELTRQQRGRQDKVQQYRTDLKKYNEQLQQYEDTKRAYLNRVEELLRSSEPKPSR